MRCMVAQLLISMFLAILAYSESSAARNKRSLKAFPAQSHRSRLPLWLLKRNRHESVSKRNGFDQLFWDDILNEPEHILNEPEPIQELPIEKDEMSNVIPGAEDYDEPPTSTMQLKANSMLDDFLFFLTLKDTGMLDTCLGIFKRR